MSGRDPVIADDLVRRALAGEPAALEELLVRHVPLLQVELLRLGPRAWRQRESIADLTQSLVSDLLPALPRARFSDLAGFRGWLMQTARNKLVDRERFHRAQCRDVRHEAHVQNDGSHADLPDPARSPSSAAIQAEDRAALRRAVDGLTEDQRRVLVMARLEGRTHLEIAATLGKSEEACRMLLARAMREVSKRLSRNS